MALTEKRIAALNAKGRYADGRGLYLQVKGPTSKSWLFRFEMNGVEHQMGIGSVDTVTLEEARDLAHNARRQLHRGINPLKERKAERAALALEAARGITFMDATLEYLKLHESKWSNPKSAKEFLSTLKRYGFPKIGNLAVSDVDTGQVLSVIEPIWLTKTETADRIRLRIEQILSWATVRGYRKGENPARWSGNLEHALPARGAIRPTVNLAAMSFADVPAFMADLRKREQVAAQGLEFTVLTAARTGEILGTQWTEIDLQAKLWTVPGARMKSGREHRVPLSDRALELLRNLPREKGNPHVFIGAGTGARIGINMMLRVLRAIRPAVTVHGFRSAFRDWVAECTAFPGDVAEAALAHSVGDKTEAAYRRGDVLEKRRKLMAAWSAYCGAAPRANVVPIRVAS